MDTGETFAAFFSKFKFLIQKEPVLLDWQVSAVKRCMAAFFFSSSHLFRTLLLCTLVCFN